MSRPRNNGVQRGQLASGGGIGRAFAKPCHQQLGPAFDCLLDLLVIAPKQDVTGGMEQNAKGECCSQVRCVLELFVAAHPRGVPAAEKICDLVLGEAGAFAEGAKIIGKLVTRHGNVKQIAHVRSLVARRTPTKKGKLARSGKVQIRTRASASC